MANDVTYCKGVDDAEIPCPLRQKCFRYMNNGKLLPSKAWVFAQAPFERDEKTNRTTCNYYFEK